LQEKNRRGIENSSPTKKIFTSKTLPDWYVYACSAVYRSFKRGSPSCEEVI